ncbi:unnamed protein product [Adineta steineri]|uniref:KIAA1045 RING finger domain-containing protein n=1 Tax=Adineta steineri TaxID=433720 RepID=A0A819N1W0_9BILA|nr:unnamed protein product [Adineta steineri]CAF3988728.1 unnamed protein product [Adineta steineri]
MIRSRISHSKDEQIIIEFDDTTRAWNDWKHGNIIHKSPIHERYIISLSECTKMYMTHNNSVENFDQSISTESIEIPSLVKIKPEIQSNCYICHSYQNQLYPCRICGNVYHQQCIKDIGNIKSYHLIKNATNLIGWSCPICEDLRTLLSTEELAETNEWIKSFGTQTIFNLDNYINTRTKLTSSNELNNHMKNTLQIFLHTIADITSNRLSQIDLLNLDISLKILRIPSKFLVNSLTSFELYRLSQLFLSLSSIDNPSITQNKFHQIFNNYFLTTMPELNSDEKHLHLNALAYCILGNTMKFDRTWNQFILDVTIPTLLGRYNHRIPSDFINQIISIKYSTADFKEYENRQSLSILMNNILQKLTQTTENESKSGFGVKCRKD